MCGLTVHSYTLCITFFLQFAGCAAAVCVTVWCNTLHASIPGVISLFCVTLPYCNTNRSSGPGAGHLACVTSVFVTHFVLEDLFLDLVYVLRDNVTHKTHCSGRIGLAAVFLLCYSSSNSLIIRLICEIKLF